jgi:hypothetical protein
MPVEEIDKITINIPIALKRKFSIECIVQGKTMTDVLLEAIRNYVKE